jgi:hypothetical protein
MCTGYVNVVKAVQSAARVLRGEPPLHLCNHPAAAAAARERA